MERRDMSRCTSSRCFSSRCSTSNNVFEILYSLKGSCNSYFGIQNPAQLLSGIDQIII